jgi:hypothetical protein
MVTRRELITAGVAGSLTASPSAAASPALEAQDANREGQREIARQIGAVEDVLQRAYLTSSLAHGYVGKIRQYMDQFLRANSKFPDFFEIGSDVFMDLYDWHVKNRQQLTVSRTGDGRYAMQFMFSSMILRPEQDPKYIGYPYDKA